MQHADLFDDLPDITPKGTITHKLPHVFVHSKEPLELELRFASTESNPEFASAYPAYEHQRMLLLQRGDKASARTLYHALMAETVVVGWKNCHKKDGTPHSYSPDVAKALFASIVKKGGGDELAEAFLRAQVADNFRESPAAIAASLGK